jgi:hypothetical protein
MPRVLGGILLSVSHQGGIWLFQVCPGDCLLTAGLVQSRAGARPRPAPRTAAP